MFSRFINRLRLYRVCPKDVKTFSFNKHCTWAKVSNVYDGDTVHLTFFYNRKLIRYRCRFAETDSPEIKTEDLLEKKAAIAARDYLRNLIDDKVVYVKFGPMDKWNRPLVNIYKGRVHINDLMVKNKYAYEYDGGTKKAFN